MKLAHISATSKSVENANRFYSHILNLREIKSYSIDGDLSEKIFGLPYPSQIILYGNDQFSVEVFIPDKYPEIKTGFSHNCLEVRDFYSFIKKCRNAGLLINEIPKGEKTLYFLKDFDDNYYEVKEASD